MNQNFKTALIIGGVILVALIVLPLVFGLVSGWQGGTGYGMMGPGMMGGFGGFGGMGIMWIVWILIIGLIVWAVIALARGVSQPTGSDSGYSDSALNMLKKRYAHGDISKEEYEEKKRDLV